MGKGSIRAYGYSEGGIRNQLRRRVAIYKGNMATHLTVTLSFWVIQDGNYPDFAQGSHTAFGLEFWAQRPLEEFAPPAA